MTPPKRCGKCGRPKRKRPAPVCGPCEAKRAAAKQARYRGRVKVSQATTSTTDGG